MTLPLLSTNQQRNDAIVLTLHQSLSIKNLSPTATLNLTYLSDRDFVTAENFGAWLAILSQTPHENWETAASAIANIFYDTVLPKHMELKITLEKGASQPAQIIHLVKSQPKYQLSEELKKLF